MLTSWPSKSLVAVAVLDDAPLVIKLLTAGSAACIADIVTFPLDTVKVRLQVQGQRQGLSLLRTMSTIVKEEGPRSLYNGLSAGLQRQMCFASVRLGLYDNVKNYYQDLFDGSKKSDGMHVGTRVAAGITTGALAVLFAQPTDVVKIRYQARQSGQPARYTSTIQAYKMIAKNEGVKGLWRGTFPNIGRNAIVNVSEIVCYDIIKEMLLRSELMEDNVPCHFTAAVIAGFCTTVVASPLDVVRARYMNSPPGEYRGAIDCAVKTFKREGTTAFFKGFTPSFCRLVSWNIVLWLTYEQLKKTIYNVRHPN